MRRIFEKRPDEGRQRLAARRADPIIHAKDLARRRTRYAERPDVRVQAKMARDQYRETRRTATPPWVDMAAIRTVYERATQLGMEVDHIVPLRGKTVSGLHVPWNLQALPPIANRLKSNRFEAAA